LDISKEGKASMSLKGMVRAGEENTLVLYPNESKTPVKAWLELYTPNEKDLALTRRIYTGSNTSP
jgi:hypothetical protein